MNIRINFWASGDLAAEIQQRGGYTEATRTSLTRYFDLLQYARFEIRQVLTHEERRFLAEIPLTNIGDPLDLDIINVIRDMHDDRYGYDFRHDLIDKLILFTNIQAAALIDALERYQRAKSTGMAINTDLILD